MAGHSKWNNIKKRKGAQDAKRGKLFTKLIKEITVAARLGDPDPACNPRLRLAVDKAKSASMPKDNIQRAIDKGAGNLEGADYQEFTMEGYGPGGVAVLIDIMTDNRNRTASTVRVDFNRNGGNLGTNGCVAYMFKRQGVILVAAEGVDEDALMDEALEAGADDMAREGDSFELLTDPNDFIAVRDALQTASYSVSSAEITFLPDTRVSVEGKAATQFMGMLDALEDNDDVQNIYHNADISDEELERLSGA